MSIRSDDITRPRLSGFGDIGSPMPADDDGWLPDDLELTGDTDEGLEDIELEPDEAATSDDAPLIDLDQLTPEETAFLKEHFSGGTEETFARDKAELQSRYDTQIAQVEADNENLLAANASLQAYSAALRKFALDLATKHREPGSFHEFDNQAKEAIGANAAERRRTAGMSQDWYRNEVSATRGWIEQRATNQQGVQLFDPAGDTDIKAAETAYLKAADAYARSGGRNQRHRDTLVMAKTHLENLVTTKREDGIAQSATKGRGQRRTNTARSNAATRGVQTRGATRATAGAAGRSAAAGSDVDKLMGQARKIFQQRNGRAPTNADYSVVYDIMTTLE